MNLQKMYAAQQALRHHINYNEPDRFEKLVLALLVEVGECANEWRGFKFWSKDREPRTKITCMACHGIGEVYQPIDGYQMTCPHCDGQGVENSNNPLLEEYADGLHFVLELGIEKGWTPAINDLTFRSGNITKQFLALYEHISIFKRNANKDNYYNLLSIYAGLGEMLGFTRDQIEQAYYSKNQINHERQANGY